MARVLFTATMSLDGFITGPDGDMSWLARFAGGGEKMVSELIGQAGSLLIGRRTYGGDDPNRGGGVEVDLERTRVEVEPVATYLWFRVVR